MEIALNILIILIPIVLTIFGLIISNSKASQNRLPKKYLYLFITLNVVLLLSGIGNVILQQRQRGDEERQILNQWQRDELSPSALGDVIYPQIALGNITLAHSGISDTPFIDWGFDQIYLWIENGQLKLSLTLRDSNGEVICLIDANHFSYRKYSEYDINYDSTGLEIIDSNSSVVLQIDIIKGIAYLYGILYDKDGGSAVFGIDSWQFNPPGIKPTLSIKPKFLHPGYKYFSQRVDQ